MIPDLFETWNLKFNSTLFSWCVFNSGDIIEAPDQTDYIHNMKAESIRVFFDTFYQKVVPAVRSIPKRFSNLNFFFKEEPMHYFHDVFLTLTLPHQHEDENNLKKHHEKASNIRFKLFILWYYTNIVIEVQDYRTFYFQIQTSPELTNISWCVSNFNVRPSAWERNQLKNKTFTLTNSR